MDAILVNYPLSANYLSNVTIVLGQEPAHLSLLELRRQSLMRMVRELIGMRFDRLVVPEEDPNGSALAPVLFIIAALTRSRQIYHMSPDLELSKVSRFGALGLAISLILTSIAMHFRTNRARKESAKLISSERIKPR